MVAEAAVVARQNANSQRVQVILVEHAIAVHGINQRRIPGIQNRDTLPVTSLSAEHAAEESN